MPPAARHPRRPTGCPWVLLCSLGTPRPFALSSLLCVATTQAFAISSLLPSGTPRLPSGWLGVSLGIRSTYVGNLGPRRTTHRGRSSRARERRGFPFVIKGLAQGSARNDVILIHLAVARVCLRACQGCARGLLGPRRGPRGTPRLRGDVLSI